MLHERYGDDFLPVYSQVSFSRVPYREAHRSGEVQEAVLGAFAKNHPAGAVGEEALARLRERVAAGG